MENLDELSMNVAELREEEVLDNVRRYLDEGIDPMDIVDLCHKGMIRVGEYYEGERYFISGLIMAGEIMRQVGELVLPLIKDNLENSKISNYGSILLGTVEGDIHFIGKDIFKVLARGYGFEVHDLGVDVPVDRFLEAITKYRPDIIGFSSLINSTLEPMKDMTTNLRESVPQDLAPKAYVIGGRVDEMVCDEVGADYWTDDGMRGVRLCMRIING